MVPPFQRRKAAEVLVEAVDQRRQFELEPIGISLLSENSMYGPVRLGGSGRNAVSIASWRGLRPAALVPLAVARCLVSSLANGAATVKLQPAGRVGGGPDRPDLSSCKKMILRLVLSRSGGLSWRHPRLCAFDTSFPALYNALNVAGLVNDLAASESLTDVSATGGPC